MTPRKRLLVLVSLAAALWFGRDFLLKSTGSRDKPGTRATTVKSSAARVAAAAIDASVCTVPSLVLQRDLFVAAADGDPFSPTQREVAPPPPPPPPPPPVAVVAPPPPAPPPAPQLPYRYYGTVKEKGLPASVFLSLGNALILAKAGDVLEGGYRLESIAPRELVFVHTQQKLTLRLSVDGESTWP
jgi:hypothetical protein